jgi:hypothetical protein
LLHTLPSVIPQAGLNAGPEYLDGFFIVRFDLGRLQDFPSQLGCGQGAALRSALRPAPSLYRVPRLNQLPVARRLTEIARRL